MNPAQLKRKSEIETAITLTRERIQAANQQHVGGGLADMHVTSLQYAGLHQELNYWLGRLEDINLCEQVGCEPEELDPGLYFCLRCDATWETEVEDSP